MDMAERDSRATDMGRWGAEHEGWAWPGARFEYAKWAFYS